MFQAPVLATDGGFFSFSGFRRCDLIFLLLRYGDLVVTECLAGRLRYSPWPAVNHEFCEFFVAYLFFFIIFCLHLCMHN